MASFDRRDTRADAADREYDVVVVGAGMTGTGVAVDAATRGYRVALLDAGDIAVGTSSKSSKMVHGGLRYLQQREFRLVFENLRERQRLLDNAPHLVRPLPFLIPLFGRDGVVSRALVRGYASALRLYDLGGGWRIGHRHRRVTREESLAFLPSLDASRLVASFLYYDARGDDARVALTLARSAADAGATVLTYARVTGLERSGGRVTRVHVRDEVDGSTFTVSTRTVVNASGVWADRVASDLHPGATPSLTPAKGVHVTVPRHRLPADVAAVLAVPGDRRSVFVVPFEDAPFTFVGTTDTPYDESLDDPRATADDVLYLLGAVNASTSSDLTPADVTGVWAGLRPLLSSSGRRPTSSRTADLSRRHRVSDDGDGVIHVTGGKWTTYRQMAEDAVDALGTYLGRQPTHTVRLALHGVGSWRPANTDEEHLYRRYGEDAREVLALIEATPAWGARPIAGLPYRAAEFVYGVRHEMAQNLVDLLTRRTRAHLQDARATAAAALDIARLVAPDLGWDDAEAARQAEAYRALARDEFTSAGLPWDDPA